MNQAARETDNKSFFNLLIEGRIGGKKHDEQLLFEIAVRSIERGVKVYLLPEGPIRGATEEDPRVELLMTRVGQIPSGVELDCWISNTKQLDRDGARCTIWITSEGIHYEINDVAHDRGGFLEMNEPATLLAGINSMRFHPGVAPFPLPVSDGKFILLYHGSFASSDLRRLGETFRQLNQNSEYCLVINDYGYEEAGMVQSLNIPGVIRVTGLVNERQLAGFYTAGHCLLAPRKLNLAIYKALACAIPVLTDYPVAIHDWQWDPLEQPRLFWTDLPKRIMAMRQNYSDWQQETVKACLQVQSRLNWQRVVDRICDAWMETSPGKTGEG